MEVEYEYRMSEGAILRRGPTLRIEVLHSVGKWVEYSGREAYMDWHTGDAASEEEVHREEERLARTDAESGEVA